MAIKWYLGKFLGLKQHKIFIARIDQQEIFPLVKMKEYIAMVNKASDKCYHNKGKAKGKCIGHKSCPYLQERN